MSCFFFFNDTATTEIYTLSLHDALLISLRGRVSDRPSPSRGGLALHDLTSTETEIEAALEIGRAHV